jgi:hypothetical protein
MHYSNCPFAFFSILPSKAEKKRREEKITLNLIFKNLTTLSLDPFYVFSCEIEVEKTEW